VDSTCLIGLERINRLDIIPALFHPVFVTSDILSEIGSIYPWMQVEDPSNSALEKSIALLVDKGEASVITLAHEKGFKVILDDRQARLIAKQLMLSVIGTIGLLIEAKRKGVIQYLNPVIQDLEMNGFYLSNALKNEAIRIVNE
jgi:predicted nucleic acid-binding protein